MVRHLLIVATLSLRHLSWLNPSRRAAKHQPQRLQHNPVPGLPLLSPLACLRTQRTNRPQTNSKRMKTSALGQPNSERELPPRLRPQPPRPRSKRKQSNRQLRTMPSRQKGGVQGVLRREPLEVRRSELLLMMMQGKEHRLELLPGPWWVGPNKDEPTKHPSSRRRGTCPNSNNRKKRKQRPRINRVSTNSSVHSLVMDARGYSV